MPGEIIRAIGSPGRKIVFASVVIDIRGDLIKARDRTSRAGVAVGEDKDVAFAGKARFDPAALMLEVEFFIADVSSIIGLGVAPAVEEIAAVVVDASFVACCFFRSSAVVDDPDLIEVMGTNEDLVELGVVVHGVDIGPARTPVLVEVDVG